MDADTTSHADDHDGFDHCAGCQAAYQHNSERRPMSEYTPTTQRVREGYPRSYYKSMDEEYAEFDRWLAGVISRAIADAIRDPA